MGFHHLLVTCSRTAVVMAAVLLCGCGIQDRCNGQDVVADHSNLVADGVFRLGTTSDHWDLRLDGDSVAVLTIRKGDSLFQAEFSVEQNGTHLSDATE